MSSGAKTRMVSFRVSLDEYESFRELCLTYGIRSVSELARVGVNLLREKPSHTPRMALEARMGIVEARLRMLTLKIDELSKSVGQAQAAGFYE